MKKIKLNPHGLQNSFYGKAIVEDWGVVKLLVSYKTVVAYINRDGFHRTWNDWSLTTMNHIKAFCYEYGITNNMWSLNKKWWMSLPIEPLPKNMNKSTDFDMDEYRMRKEEEMWQRRMYLCG